MEDEPIFIHDENMTDAEVIAAMVEFFWEHLPPEHLALIEHKAEEAGYSCGQLFLTGHLVKERTKFDTVDDWLFCRTAQDNVPASVRRRKSLKPV